MKCPKKDNGFMVRLPVGAATCQTPEEFAGQEAAMESQRDNFEYDPDCPACLRHLPHTRQEHEEALMRNWEASLPDEGEFML